MMLKWSHATDITNILFYSVYNIIVNIMQLNSVYSELAVVNIKNIIHSKGCTGV